jgi:peptidoglycan/xylan/chitin deacetylase (PgdA/CDA1 family)
MTSLFRSAVRESAANEAIGSLLLLLGLAPLRSMAERWMDHLGLVLMFHHVGSPRGATGINRGLMVSTDTLERVLNILLARGYELVSMDEVPDRLTAARPKRFAAFTFDDGCRDTLACAAPILARRGAPFTVYVTTGFADGTVYPWWHVLERAVDVRSKLELETGRGVRFFDTASNAAKAAAAVELREILLNSPSCLRAEQTFSLAKQAKIDLAALTRELYLDWSGLRTLARVPGCTIGAHSCTHPRLSQLAEEAVWSELADSRTIIEERLGVKPRHFSYPYGVTASCADREFELASRLGYLSAVTARRGVLTEGNAGALMSLPRVPINGNFEHPLMLEALISGLPLLLFSLVSRVIGHNATEATGRQNK